MNDLTHLETRARDAIARLYEAFEAPTPKIIEGCPCCLDTRKVDKLLARPLRDLTGNDLWRYVTGAFYTVGSQIDFRYLLPRIFELALDGASLPDTEIILNKLELASWQSWSSGERAAIEHLLDVWLDLAIAHDLVFEDVRLGETESFLCGTALAGIDFSRWRERLAHEDAKPIINDLNDRLPCDWSSFWKDCPEELSALKALARSLSDPRVPVPGT